MSTLEKPAGSIWSDDQWRAIAESGDDILVAAAAGSGKTAVLVERIIRKISREENGFSVDRLLVATFTKAAASEMRQRIREALDRELEQNPGNEHLQRQLALLGKASITTLHSFCLEVIRRYYQLIPLDPGFRILNEQEAEIMRQELLEELFEDKYGEAGEDGVFVKLVDWFSGERSDDAVHALVQRLYNFARSHPWPEAWLHETADAFMQPDTAALGGTAWVKSILGEAELSLAGAAAQLEQGIRLASSPGGPAPYAETLAGDLAQVQAFREAIALRPWEELYGLFSGAAFGKLKPVKKDTADPELQASVKELRESAKKTVTELQTTLFGRPVDAFLEEMREAAPLMKELAETVIEFGERYRAEKAGRGLVDFSDLEHYCLRILRHEESEPGRSLPSDAAMEYRSRFDEVLLDEYQDTNSVQEEIVRLISREEPGNRFMVGDMKQSIYRFRLAEPGLFLDKYRSYGKKQDASASAADPAAQASEREGAGGIGSARQAGAGESLTSDRDNTAAAPAERTGAGDNRDAALQPGAGDQYTAAQAGTGDQRPTVQAVPAGAGRVIDLARNFRSRLEVVHAVNMVFRQIMNETVAEIGYDERAELVYGASYYGAGGELAYTPEVMLIDRGGSGMPSSDENTETEGGEVEAEAAETETAQLEARAIARRIASLTGAGGGEPLLVYDKHLKMLRPVVHGDIVILLRSARIWAPLMIEELRLAGIPAQGDTSQGYFQATEVEIMLSLLKVIDNPQQDIPLASVLRSPIYGLSEEELAQVRLASPGSYYDAVLAAVQPEQEHGLEEAGGDYPAANTQVKKTSRIEDDLFRMGERNSEQDYDFSADEVPLPEEYAPAGDIPLPEEYDSSGGSPLPDEYDWTESSPLPEPALSTAEPRVSIPAKLRRKLAGFLADLAAWRDEARQGSVSALIWRVYGDTGYLDWVGGLPGGAQRQNNLKALYDRALQFEADTSSRGLFRFLVFIARLRENGGDLGAGAGTADAGGGVTLMTIHKSKGLEFPVVFVAGMSKAFNRQDLNASFLMHKELGFGPRFLERETRVSYPTLPFLAIHRRSRLELLAEEMRVLYVALTRPREKLILVGTVRDLTRKAQNWAQVQDHPELVLQDHLLARGTSYLDWVGPSLIRHPSASVLRKLAGREGAGPALLDDPSSWSIAVLNASNLHAQLAETADDAAGGERETALERLQQGESVADLWSADPAGIASRLEWAYPFAAAGSLPAKTSVTELKSLLASEDSPVFDLLEGAGESESGSRTGVDRDNLRLRRPKFMEKRSLTPAERGTAYHTVMQHLPLDEGSEGYGTVNDGANNGGTINDGVNVRTGNGGAVNDGANNGRAVNDGITDRIENDVVDNGRTINDGVNDRIDNDGVDNGKTDSGRTINEANSAGTVERTIARLERLNILTKEQADAVAVADIEAFLASNLGRRLCSADWSRREMPFSYIVSAEEAYAGTEGLREAAVSLADAGAGMGANGPDRANGVLIQGVIDCLFRENGRLILVDYKSDAVLEHRGGLPALKERYRFQLELYGRAIRDILGEEVAETWLYFFDGGHEVRL